MKNGAFVDGDSEEIAESTEKDIKIITKVTNDCIKKGTVILINQKEKNNESEN